MTSTMTKPSMPPTTSSTFFSRANINLQTQDDTSIQTVPELIEYNATNNPHHPFCIQAQKQSQDARPRLLSVSHLQLKRAIAQCQAWLVNTLVELKLPSISSDGTVYKGPPVALYVESDVGLLIHLFSLMSLGVPVRLHPGERIAVSTDHWQALLLSARLSPTAIHHLLGSTAACAIIISPRLKNTAKEALSLFSTTGPQPAIYAQAAFTSYLDPQADQEHTDGSICKPGYYVRENDRNVLILHSSGTTGLPKPIPQSHKWLLCFATCHEFSSDEETLSLSLSTLPLYHVSVPPKLCFDGY
jgi:acyl-CoA synthetase (AMP-forming)/AMP-acid ligase II